MEFTYKTRRYVTEPLEHDTRHHIAFDTEARTDDRATACIIYTMKHQRRNFCKPDSLWMVRSHGQRPTVDENPLR